MNKVVKHVQIDLNKKANKHINKTFCETPKRNTYRQPIGYEKR